MCGGSNDSAVRMSASHCARVCPGSAYMMSRLKVSNACAASSTAAMCLRRSCTRPSAFRCASLKLCTPDGQPRHAGIAESAETVPLEGARVGLQRDLGIGLQPHRARTPASRRSMAAGENRLGVPPPMNTLCTVRPQISGSAGLQVGHQGVDIGAARAGLIPRLPSRSIHAN
jgi:hypothetical protein